MDEFWKVKTLTEMSVEEWESLCDGCAKCCIHKLQDIDTEEVFYTRVVCKFLDMHRCRCTDYENRHVNVPTCVVLTPSLSPNLNGCLKPAHTVWFLKKKTCRNGTTCVQEVITWYTNRAIPYGIKLFLNETWIWNVLRIIL